MSSASEVPTAETSEGGNSDGARMEAVGLGGAGFAIRSSLVISVTSARYGNPGRASKRK